MGIARKWRSIYWYTVCFDNQNQQCHSLLKIAMLFYSNVKLNLLEKADCFWYTYFYFHRRFSFLLGFLVQTLFKGKAPFSHVLKKFTQDILHYQLQVMRSHINKLVKSLFGLKFGWHYCWRG